MDKMGNPLCLRITRAIPGNKPVAVSEKRSKILGVTFAISLPRDTEILLWIWKCFEVEGGTKKFENSGFTKNVSCGTFHIDD